MKGWEKPLKNHTCGRWGHDKRGVLLACAVAWGAIGLGPHLTEIATAQSNRRPIRVKAPDFESNAFQGIFFVEPADQLRGEMPSGNRAETAIKAARPIDNIRANEAIETTSWQRLIKANSLEDLVKGSKLRLEKLLATPSAFLGGGYSDAKREFALQALLFAIIERYPTDVRWKSSAAAARATMARMASSLDDGSPENFREAKQRLLDLGDLLNGSKLDAPAQTALNWGELMDRSTLMELLEWAHQEQLAKITASETAFESRREELSRFAELVSVLGTLALQGDMPDADDEEYAGFAQEMIAGAGQVSSAVDTANFVAARTAAARVGQSCTACHEQFR